MLQSMKHRGPDSTGYALYHAPAQELTVRINLAESTAPRDLDFAEDVRRRRHEVEARVRAAGAEIKSTEDVNDYTFSATLTYHGDLKRLADHIESVPHTEVLSLGHALDIVKDLGDAKTVSGSYGLDEYFGSHGIGHVRMATESDVDIANAHPYWSYPFSDVAVVHNGQLTSYHQWQAQVPRSPLRLDVRLGDVAVYLADRMAAALARGRHEPFAGGPGQRLHLHLRLRGAGGSQGQAASPWSSTRRRHGGAGVEEMAIARSSTTRSDV
jgi:glutamate synthase domain-containing protein 1